MIQTGHFQPILVLIMQILYNTMKTECIMKIEVEGFEVIEKLVKEADNSGRIYVPKD